jgi:hypothetical protein
LARLWRQLPRDIDTGICNASTRSSVKMVDD